ncbi:uncharacterized protein LOC125557540 [Nematostella vectensis]|uniref:uncharacterized protein LOC125557540 n=1 Tax=Nematostella vectensis TaxID=45351 RepID=UPI00207706E1|nr:uncharacterized protein LOC125557540 [Nematostella vectensis]
MADMNDLIKAAIEVNSQSKPFQSNSIDENRFIETLPEDCTYHVKELSGVEEKFKAIIQTEEVTTENLDGWLAEYEAINSITVRIKTKKKLTKGVIFGSGPSPYILGATLQKHVASYSDKYPETVHQLLTNTYVDDVQTGGDDPEQLLRFKQEASEIMESGGFQLHKWHSNVLEAEESTSAERADRAVDRPPVKILGIPWDKNKDELTIAFSDSTEEEVSGALTKRKMLAVINRIYDLLGLASPVTVTGKVLYSKVCLSEKRWDEAITDVEIVREWNKWLKSMKACPSVSIPRSVVDQHVTRIELHGFSDASKTAVSAAIYVVAHHADSSVRQTLLVAKSRVAPKNQSIPRLELVGAHTLTKLMTHVKEVLQGQPIQSYQCWVDSTTILYWIKGKGTWSQFVRNRTKVIQERDYLKWNYVPTGENPADIGSRGAGPGELSDMWLHGPNWLSDKAKWPPQPEVTDNDEVASETVKSRKEKLLVATEEPEKKGQVDALLEQCSSYWKLRRVVAYIQRFGHNCRSKSKRTGPLTTEEINKAESTLIRRAQVAKREKVETSMEVQIGEDGIARCVGRIAGYQPIILPRDHKLTTLIIKQVHEKAIHGGVSMTMSLVREKFWVPKLRAQVKRVIHNCNKCKRYRIKPVLTPGSTASAQLPSFRTEFSEPFDVTGVDFAGPIYYRTKSEQGKAYIALFTCAATRAVHLKLCPDLSAPNFQRALKEFVARRGCPQMIVSDNGKTFVATGKWLSVLKKDESLSNYLASQAIIWRFNMSRAPWWGGFFERLVGVMKNALSKAVGRSLPNYCELEDALLDVETVMNNRPLVYQGEEFDEPVITPNLLLRGRPVPILEEDLEKLSDARNVTRRMRFIQRSKEDLKKRFTREYVRSLEERQQKHEERSGEQLKVPEKGRVVLLKEDVKNKAQWKIGRVVEKITGRDGVVRGVKLKMGNGYVIERPLQLICDLEIGGDDPGIKLNPKAQVFIPRSGSRRQAKDSAKDNIKGIFLLEED